MDNIVAEYVAALNNRYKTGYAQEHTYRTALQNLFEQVMTDVQAINEPTHMRCGAPDFMVMRRGVPFGFAEAKDVDKDLDSAEYTEQFTRYRNSLNNLIITNYLEFRFYRDGEEVARVRPARLESGKIIGNTDEYEAFLRLLNSFEIYDGITIRSAAKLTKIMAGKANLLADVIKRALHGKDDSYANKTLREQYQAFQKVLISNLSNDEFADVYAQTIAYGLFAGRLNTENPAGFSRAKAGECIPRQNRFLRNLFNYIAGNEIDDRIKWIVDDLARVFAVADLSSVLKNYGKATATHDPLVHFYETFLSEYNHEERKLRGVWYTPQPVVNFIVRAVDDLLKTEFGLSDGLADDSKFFHTITNARYGDRKTGKRSSTISKEEYRVQILDPATGTGTFLAEIVRQVHEKFINNQGMWPGYVEECLLPRLNGFELLMASYAMAHLKLDWTLKETGYEAKNDSRLQIYLTDSLQEAHPDAGTMFASWLSNESQEADRVKRETPIMVVLGNPPYNGESQNNGEWIRNLIEVYKREPSGGALQERNPKWLNDDYVKFIRYAEHYVEQNNSGILAYISNHSFLDNPTFRGMRAHLLRTFDKIFVLDLHGNYKKKETCPDGSPDENVFDIQQGVSISLFVKTGKKERGTFAEVRHAELFGKREDKYAFLAERSLSDIQFQKIENRPPYYFFVPKDFSNADEYDKGFSLTELFSVNSVGIVTADDKTLIDDAKSVLIDKVERKFEFLADKTKIQKISYRPFDNRFVYYDGEILERPREQIMRNFIGRENIGLVVSKQVKAFEEWHHVFITDGIFESCIVSNKTSEISYGFPLYTFDPLDGTRRVNFNGKIVRKIQKAAGKKISETDVFDYIYAVLHIPEYRKKYADFLKTDFPKIPYPENAKEFNRLSGIGGRLREIHLLQGDETVARNVSFPVTGDNVIEKISYQNGRVYINKTQYFDNVPSAVWDFFIGGYQPAQKWLKDRKGMTLDYTDIRHYQKIVAALIQTDEIMQKELR
ncbi:MAG: N-6 DNA methylase [Alphaproteobacteria bacterium]|nr:N-6 DNA methylase [Alphaproteobacteria bacterium]